MRDQFFKRTVFVGSSLALMLLTPVTATGQTALPQVNVDVNVETAKKKPPPRRVTARRAPSTSAPAQTQQATPAEAAQRAAEAAQRAVADKNVRFDQTRANILADRKST